MSYIINIINIINPELKNLISVVNFKERAPAPYSLTSLKIDNTLEVY